MWLVGTEREREIESERGRFIPRLWRPHTPLPIEVPLVATPVIESDVKVKAFQIMVKKPGDLPFLRSSCCCALAILACASWNGHLPSCFSSMRIYMEARESE